MKKLLLAIIFFAPLFSIAQSNSLSGNWKEVHRETINGKHVNFSDTIKIGFLTGNEYTWMKKGGFIYRGTYKIENGALDMGSRYFTIVKQTRNRLVIKDDEAIYEFMPYTLPAKSRLPQEKEPMMVTNTSQMTGTWKVFKGTSSATIKELDLGNRIKTVIIFDSPDATGYIGSVSGGEDPKGSPSWFISKFENGTIYCGGKSNRSFNAAMTDDELILREGSQTFFLKQFNE